MSAVALRRVLRFASLVLVLGAALSVVAFTDTSVAGTTALSASAIGPARYARANDGRVHVEYDLLLTNSFVGDVTLKSLVVRSRGRVLQRLGPKRFARHTHPILQESKPVSTISPSETVMVLVDVPLPRRARTPKRLTHRISYKLPKNFPPNAVIDSTTVRGPRLRVGQRKPLVIPPPLRGSGWWVGGGCCNPDQRHRGLLLASNGHLVPTEMFDIDWLQIANGRLFSGDGKKLTDYPGFGAKIYSVSRGRVVKVVDDKPEAPLTGPNNELDGANNFAGNRVIIKMAPHRYAFYAHFQPHSIRVHEGQRVRPGRVLGLLGNSGNSAAPHLHFGIHNGRSPATSASLPWVFNRYRYQGSGDLTEDGHVPLTGTPSRQRQTYPLNLASLLLK